MSQYPAPPTQSYLPRRRRRWWLVVTVVVLVVLGLLVVGDRVAKAYTENRIAQQIQDQGFNTKPDVSIAGFPFLTQLMRRDLHNVNISAGKVSRGPVQIRDLNANLTNVLINNDFTGGTVENLSGTALITFGNLMDSAGGPSVTVTGVTGDEVEFKVDLGVVRGTAIARVTPQGRNKINVHVVSAGGLPLDALGPLADFTITVPLPMGMSVQSISFSAQGAIIHVVGHNVVFSQ